MMKRNKLALILFAALLAVSLIHLALLKRATDDLTGNIERLKQSCISDSSDIDLRLDELAESWDSYYPAAAFLTRSGALDEMAVSVSKLGVLSRTDAAQAAAELDSLRTRAELIYDSQLPHPSSVF